MNASERQRIFVEGLQAKVRLLTQDIETQKRVLGEKDAEIARLRAALKPFAEAARRLTRMSGEGAALVSVADLRAALKALGEEI